MSVRLMADVYDFGPTDPIDCAVLVCLANHANDDGRSCYPSLERVARMTRYCEKTVSRSIAAMEADGWLTVKRGRGRGVVSEYTLQTVRLKKGTLSPLLPDDEKGTLTPKKGTLTTEKGDSQGNPPAPPNRKNRQETSENPSTSGEETAARGGMEIEAKPAPEAKAKRPDSDAPKELLPAPETDPRHAPVRELVKQLQREALDREIWDGRCAGALARLLRIRGPQHWPLETLLACVRNRFASDVNHAFLPAVWLPRLTDYAAGPLDRFGRPPQRGAGPSDAWMRGDGRARKPQRSFDADLAAVRADVVEMGGDVPNPDAWRRVLERLKDKVDAGRLDTWLRPLRLLWRTPAGTVVLLAPNEAFAHVREHFGAVLAAALPEADPENLGEIDLRVWDGEAEGNAFVPI